MSAASVSGRNRIARQLASKFPLLNDFRAADWRAKVAALGGDAPASATKADLYKIWRKLTASAG